MLLQAALASLLVASCLGQSFQPTGKPERPSGKPERPSGKPERPSGKPERPSGKPERPSGGPPQEGGSDPCNGIEPYIANAFNSLKFSTSVGYHDMNNMRSLFVDDNDGSWALIDMKNGRVVTYDGASCSEYKNSNLILTTESMRSLLKREFMTDNFNGQDALGYTINQGDVTFRGVMTPQCVELFTLIAVNGRPYTAILRDNVRKDNVDQEIADALQPADAIISAGCTAVTDLP